MATLNLPVQQQGGGLGGIPMPLLLGGVGVLALVVLLTRKGGSSGGTASPGSDLNASLSGLQDQVLQQKGELSGLFTSQNQKLTDLLTGNQSALLGQLSNNTDYLNQQIAGTSTTLGTTLTEILQRLRYLQDPQGSYHPNSAAVYDGGFPGFYSPPNPAFGGGS